jgi:hypothetical protein
MHKKVKVVSDEKTKELLNSVSEEIQDVMKQFSNDEIKEIVEVVKHKQEQQIQDFLDGVEGISEDIIMIQKTLNTVTENQFKLMEKISTMEKEQQKPWYKKLIKGS